MARPASSTNFPGTMYPRIPLLYCAYIVFRCAAAEPENELEVGFVVPAVVAVMSTVVVPDGLFLNHPLQPNFT